MQFFPPNVHLLQTKNAKKKRFKCSQRHTAGNDDKNDDNLPYMSIAAAKDGKLVCTLRPPLDESWNFICEKKRCAQAGLDRQRKDYRWQQCFENVPVGVHVTTGPSSKSSYAK